MVAVSDSYLSGLSQGTEGEMNKHELSPSWLERIAAHELDAQLHNVLSGLDWLVEHAKLGDLSWSDLQEIKDNIKILEAKCNGNR